MAPTRLDSAVRRALTAEALFVIDEDGDVWAALAAESKDVGDRCRGMLSSWLDAWVIDGRHERQERPPDEGSVRPLPPFFTCLAIARRGGRDEV